MNWEPCQWFLCGPVKEDASQLCNVMLRVSEYNCIHTFHQKIQTTISEQDVQRFTSTSSNLFTSVVNIYSS